MANIKFSGNGSAFYTDLKTKVDEYFRQHNKAMHGNGLIYFKSALYLLTFIATYIWLVFFTPPAIIAIPVTMIFGLLTAAIGFNVMHDGSHGTFSPNKTVNTAAAWTLNLLGGSSFLWNIKHNMIHHTYTNVDGHDDDIMAEPLLRMSPQQKKLGIHRYQHLYFFVLYGLMYLGWILILDIKKYFRKQIAAKENIRFPLRAHFGFWITKIIYIALFVVLPLQFMPWTTWLTGYLIWVFTTGLIISIIFQLAHVTEQTDFVEANEEGMLENDWAVHQVKTTANFGSRSLLLSFITGGLNQQVEHHLFPKISHVHYPKLSPIVKSVCEKHGLTYLEQPTFFHAVISHIRLLRRLGTN